MRQILTGIAGAVCGIWKRASGGGSTKHLLLYWAFWLDVEISESMHMDGAAAAGGTLGSPL